ncbi:MAG TPA: ABC transporter permease, partial [Chloroflexia bacterium]|nr:ABC transporter permease [Chloroflexia bacterium]
MLALAARNLYTRPLRTLLTAVAIALGVGMIFAMRIVGVAAEQAAAEARASQVAGADLAVASAFQAHLDPPLVRALLARPEVEAVGPTYRRLEGAPDPNVDLDSFGLNYALKGTGLALLGVDPAQTLTPYKLAGGAFFSGPTAHEVLLPALWAAQHGLGIGSTLDLTTGSRTQAYTVAGLLETSGVTALAGRPLAWLPLATLQAAFGTPGALTEVLVRLKPGTGREQARDQIQAGLGRSYIVTSASGAAGQARPLIASLTDSALPLASLTMLAGGAFLVYNAFAITLAERRREIGQLRTLGMTRRQVLRQTLLEAGVLAALGSALGLGLGLLLGPGLIALIVGLVQGHPLPTLRVPLDGALLAVGTGLLMTLGVTYNLARRAGQLSPLDALRGDAEAEAGQNLYIRWGPRAALGVFVLFLALYFYTVQRIDHLDGIAFTLVLLTPFLLVLVTLLALPLGVRGVLALAVRLAPRAGVTATLAARNLARAPLRAILTAATLAIGLMLIVGLSGITRAATTSSRQVVSGLIRGDWLLLRPEFASGSLEDIAAGHSLPPLAPAFQADLDQLATEAEVIRLGNVHLSETTLIPGVDNAFALDLALLHDNPGFILSEGTWAAADHYVAAGPALILPDVIARQLNVHPGSQITLSTLAGPVPFTVALVGGPLPIVPMETGIRYFGAHPAMFFVSARSGQDKTALERRVKTFAKQHSLIFAPDPQGSTGAIFDALFGVILGLFAGLTALSGV